MRSSEVGNSLPHVPKDLPTDLQTSGPIYQPCKNWSLVETHEFRLVRIVLPVIVLAYETVVSLVSILTVHSDAGPISLGTDALDALGIGYDFSHMAQAAFVRATLPSEVVFAIEFFLSRFFCGRVSFLRGFDATSHRG